MVLLPPALAQGYFALRTGRGYLWAVLLLAATLLTHLVLGYVALVSLLVLTLVASGRSSAPNAAQRPSPAGWRRRLRGKVAASGLLGLLVALVTAYFVVPFWLDSPYMNRSVWEKPEKYDSYGYEWVLGALVRGELFDFGRFPWLTCWLAWAWRFACGVGGMSAIAYLAVLFVLWLLLYFGRPTWGVLLDLLPMSRDLHLHRLIGGVHLGAVFMAGVGLAWLLAMGGGAPEARLCCWRPSA